MPNLTEITQFCRLCLVKNNVNIPIFEDQSENGQIFVKISSCLPVTVTRDDDLPKNICSECANKLDVAYEFRKSTVVAEKQLRQWIDDINIKNLNDSSKEADDNQIIKEEPDDSFVAIPETITYESDKGSSSKTRKSGGSEPPPKRARRAAAMKRPVNIPSESDEDVDDVEPLLTKTEDSDSELDTEDHDPTFEDIPPTNVDQPGPSGVGKEGVEDEEIKLVLEPNITYRFKPGRSTSISPSFLGKLFKKVRQEDPQPQQQDENEKQSTKNTNEIVKKSYLLPHLNVFCVEHKKINTQEVMADVDEIEDDNGFLYNPFDYKIDSTENKTDVQKTIKSECITENAQTEEEKFQCLSCVMKFTDVPSYKNHVIEDHGNDPYLCFLCRKRYATTFRLSVHVSRKHCKHFNLKSDNLLCCFCYGLFRNEESLRFHYNVHHRFFKESCAICKEEFPNMRWQMEHMYIFHSQSNFKCDKCTSVFVHRLQLITHEKNVHEKFICRKLGQFVCQICFVEQHSGTSLYMHKKEVHEQDTEIGKFLCDICGNIYLDHSALLSHLKSHSKRYICDVCGKEYKSLSSLKTHQQGHVNEKPHMCDTCGKCFVTPTVLKTHKRIHTGERPFICSMCKKGHQTKVNLKKHMRICDQRL